MSEQNIINDIKHHNWKESWLDFSVFLYEHNRLIISGSDDLSYYHTLEIIMTRHAILAVLWTGHAILMRSLLSYQVALTMLVKC